MTVPITGMYCDRCGTRHEFKRARPGGVARIREFTRGVRGYVLNEAPTFGDAMTDAWARLEEDGALERDAEIHETFAFCLDCRGYVCHDCWNVEAGRCLTCVPLPGTEAAAEAAIAARLDLLAGPAPAKAPQAGSASTPIDRETAPVGPATEAPLPAGEPAADVMAEAPAAVAATTVEQPVAGEAASGSDGAVEPLGAAGTAAAPAASPSLDAQAAHPPVRVRHHGAAAEPADEDADVIAAAVAAGIMFPPTAPRAPEVPPVATVEVAPEAGPEVAPEAGPEERAETAPEVPAAREMAAAEERVLDLAVIEAAVAAEKPAEAEAMEAPADAEAAPEQVEAAEEAVAEAGPVEVAPTVPGWPARAAASVPDEAAGAEPAPVVLVPGGGVDAAAATPAAVEPERRAAPPAAASEPPVPAPPAADEAASASTAAVSEPLGLAPTAPAPEMGPAPRAETAQRPDSQAPTAVLRPGASSAGVGGAATPLGGAATPGRPRRADRRRPAPPPRRSPAPVHCRNCGLQVPAVARFCRRCGGRQAEDATVVG